MKTEDKLDLLTKFANYNLHILNILNPDIKVNDEITQRESIDSSPYMECLLQKPVSKISRFSNDIWDFNEDYPTAARNIKGAKLRIDFSKYSVIPKFVLIELKIIFELVLLNKNIFKPQHTGKKKQVKKNLKPNSIIPIFEAGLTFINEIFKQAEKELGYEFIQSKIKTFSDIGPELYYKAAANYERVKGRELDQFFDYLRNPASYQYVFQTPVTYVELNSLPWKKLPSTDKKKKEQVLPDRAFESLSKVASFIVVDFLNAIGDKEKISDIHALERLTTSNYSSWAYQNKINHKVLNRYIALRLKSKDYSSSFIKEQIIPYDWIISKDANIKSSSTLRNELKKQGYEPDNLLRYFNLISYACLYLVGQYTGMRPSELSEVRVNNCSCLVEENGIWFIESTVKKHRGKIRSNLFDDRWVAIPIVKDAILAASYISKIKASPYLASNVDTVHSDKLPTSMTSTGIKSQIDNFINQILGKSAVNEINFNPYMLRHTLTYQLFRAEVGLPVISFQLKHFVEGISKYTSLGTTSSVTLGYGDIGQILSKDGGRKGDTKSLRRSAELDAIKNAHNPHGTYYGGKAKEHKERLIKVFQGYMAEGKTLEEVYEAMADQGIAVVYMGQGLCYGGRNEEYDPSLPCIGSLRCNPVRCKQAVVTSKHAPKWREIYTLNKLNLNKPEYAHSHTQIMAAMNEAKMVLESLGEPVEL